MAAASGNDSARHRSFALIIDSGDRLDDADRRAMVLRRLDQRLRVLWKAGPAVTGTRVKKLSADPVVESDAARDILYVRPDHFAEIGDLVDKADLRRQKGVGGVFREFGSAPIGDQERRLIEVKRPINLAHHR